MYVDSIDVRTLTILVPINMATKYLSKLSDILTASFAVLFPSSAITLKRILLQEENAVSVAAKKLPNISNNIMII